MKTHAGINLRALAVYAMTGLMLLVLIFWISDVSTQERYYDSFRTQYDELISLDETADVATVDSAVIGLLQLHQQQPGIYDSLITPLLIWHYKRKSETISEEEAILFLHSYRAIIQDLGTTYHADLARFYSMYLPSFWSRYQTDSIAHYLDLMEQHIDAAGKPVEVKTQWFYEKGRHAFHLGDYQASLTFFQRGLEYVDDYFPQHRLKYRLINAIGIGYRRTGRIDEAINHYEDILSRLPEEVHTAGMTGTYFNNLGLAYKDRGDWQNAISRLAAGIAYYIQYKSPTFPDIGSGYDNIAICYENQGKLDSALFYSQKSLDFILQNLGPTHPDLLLPMYGITSVLLKQKKLDEAVAMNSKAKSLIVELGWTADDPGGDYYLDDGFDVFASSEAIQRALYDTSRDTSYLMKAIEDGARFMALTDYAYDYLKEDLSKEIFQLEHGKVFSACVSDLHALYEIQHDASLVESAFAYSEKFKSLELLYAAQKDKADQVERYRLLNEQYNALMDSISYYESLSDSSDTLSGVQTDARSKLNEFQEALYLWKDHTRQTDPDYYQLIYHPEPMTIAELQHTLVSGDQCILSYHLAEDFVYMFVITADEVHFVKQAIQPGLLELISEFRNSIYANIAESPRSDSVNISMADRFVQAGTALYAMLIEPVSELLEKRVVIIVDKSLGYIPFDLLLKEKPQVAYHFQDHGYLLHEHAISYSYSARLWMDMRLQESGPGIKMLAIAPDFPEANNDNTDLTRMRTGLARLYFNKAEVREINKDIPGKLLVGKRATKKSFIQHSPHYAILHLATHSQANDEEGDYSFLAFTDNDEGDARLLASEIYHLDLHAELVTLSACETGLGELKSGEGIISLARAFSFAGAKSIVSSLWSVNDQSTPIVMASFYHNIKQGMSKDIALQKAKMEFVASKDHADAHPYYWGGFICVGDMRPLMIADPILPRILQGIAALVVILMIIFLVKKFRTK